jgi:hypothetical protein
MAYEKARRYLSAEGERMERAAIRVTDPQVQSTYRQMCRQWHEKAERQQAKDQLRPAGRIDMTRSGLEGFGRSLSKQDEVCRQDRDDC